MLISRIQRQTRMHSADCIRCRPAYLHVEVATFDLKPLATLIALLWRKKEARLLDEEHDPDRTNDYEQLPEQDD